MCIHCNKHQIGQVGHINDPQVKIPVHRPVGGENFAEAGRGVEPPAVGEIGGGGEILALAEFFYLMSDK